MIWSCKTYIMAGPLGLKVFGYGGAFLSSLTDVIRAQKRFSAGDNDAGSMYALSAVTILLGGSAMTHAGVLALAGTASAIPVAGFLIAGIILVGFSIHATMEAIDNTDGPLEKWLDACIFGQQQLPDNPAYNHLADEQQAWLQNMLYPRLLSTKIIRKSINRARRHYFMGILEIYLPSFSRHSYIAVSCDLLNDKGTVIPGNTTLLQPEQFTAHLQGVKAVFQINMGEYSAPKIRFTVNYQANPEFGESIIKTYTARR